MLGSAKLFDKVLHSQKFTEQFFAQGKKSFLILAKNFNDV